MAPTLKRAPPTPIRILAATPGTPPRNLLKLTIHEDPTEPNCDVALRYNITYGKGYLHCDALWYNDQEWQIIAEECRYEEDGNRIHTIDIIPINEYAKTN